ncbi:phosphoenolpyruvate carboxykinase (ATP) [Armatimonadetes bacterium Uphvl-Ar2]|nr:phosphoenolpyruvate carboxykinase (ATP) [Armatimonadetes bacterium Uphvl-Ar2]
MPTTPSAKPLDLSAATVHFNRPVPVLVEDALRREIGVLAHNGALVAYTGKYTGRTPKDKHVVRDANSEPHVWWENNQAMSPEEFDGLVQLAQEKLAGRTIDVVDTIGGAAAEHQLKVRFLVESPYHALFIRQMLIRPTAEQLADFEPDWTVVDLGTVKYERTVDGTDRDAVIAIDFSRRMVIIMGTLYAGEMKKSVFSIMNYILPLKGVMSMHCSANIGKDGDTALFFGLSGTGKTTLSADPDRFLIGDDEHGWDDNGVFNVEGGCYAKCIDLSREKEPDIWDAIRFGAVLENVEMTDARVPMYESKKYTENTRCAYPLEHISNAVFPSVGGHPKNIIFLTADAFGVLPPISRLSPEEAMVHFLNGYTAKVAGTEAGVTEPQMTFSTCFGAPFMTLHPKVYADLLRAKIAEHGSKVWLVNTGWTGGPYGVGKRMDLKYTRAMITAALAGQLDNVRFEREPVFQLEVPTSVPGVPNEVLMPRETWADKDAYDRQANDLHAKFVANAAKFGL